MSDIVFVTWGQPMHLDVIQNIIKYMPNSAVLTTMPKIKEACVKDNITCILCQNEDIDFREYINKSKIVVACDFYDVCGLNKKGITCVQIFHGVSGKIWAYSHDNVPLWDKFLIAGDYSAKRLKDYHRIDDNRIFKTGSPKLDRLFDNSYDRHQILKSLGLDANRKTILYCPTHANLSSEVEMLGYLKQLDRLGANILIKLHDASKYKQAYFNRMRELKNIVLVDDYRITQYMFVSDLLISDCSSVAFDYLTLNRPIIFLADYKAVKHLKTNTIADKYIEIDYRNVGERLNNINLLGKTIYNCLSKPENKEDIRLRVRDELFSYCDGYSGKRAADILRNALIGR